MTGSLRGFGLVELMVAMLLGLTLVLALVQYLSSSRQTWLWQQQSARMQEDARYVLGRLSRDLRASGSYGCLDLEQALPGRLPEVLARPVRFEQGVLTLITGLPVQPVFETPQTIRAADYGARWLLAGDCRQRVSLGEEHTLMVLPGDWLVPLRQIDYRQQGGRIQVRVNGVGNFETLIEHVARFEPGFALAENIGNVGVSGSYQATLSSAEQARLRSVRIELALEPGASGVSVGSGRGQVFRQVTRLRNRPDGFVNE